MTRFKMGFEWEYANGDVEAVYDSLVTGDLWRPDDNAYEGGSDFQHYNHCSCDGCEWGGSLLRHHEDPTVSGEIVSDPFEWPSQKAEKILDGIARVVRAGDCRPGPRAGCHIHISRRAALDAKMVDYFALYEDYFHLYARQHNVQVRNYNHRLDQYADREPEWFHRFADKWYMPGHGSNFAVRHNTWEFRIWNSIRNVWRLRMALDITAAFTAAVAAAPDDVREHSFASSLAEFIAPYLRADTLGYMLRHHHNHLTREVTSA